MPDNLWIKFLGIEYLTNAARGQILFMNIWENGILIIMEKWKKNKS